MLARGDYDYPPVPPDIEFAAIEPFRERTFRHPLLLVSRPLANFSITLSSARGRRQAEWTHAVTALTGTYLATVPLSDEGLRSVWREAGMAQGLRTRCFWRPRTFRNAGGFFDSPLYPIGCGRPHTASATRG